jgi:hypothetical protein
MSSKTVLKSENVNENLVDGIWVADEANDWIDLIS